MNLFRVAGTVSDVHVVRAAEPQQQVGIYFRGGAEIQQTVNVDFTHIADASVPVALGREIVCRAGVIGLLGC